MRHGKNKPTAHAPVGIHSQTHTEEKRIDKQESHFPFIWLGNNKQQTEIIHKTLNKQPKWAEVTMCMATHR